MSKSTTRRSVVAGLAAAPVAALPAVAGEPDPIFAAIERHKVAFRNYLVASRARFITMDVGPNVDHEAVAAADEADHGAWDALQDAAWALVDQPPTTIAGALALVEYIERFNSGAFIEPADPEKGLDEWESKILYWPLVDDDDDVDEVDAGKWYGFNLLAAVVRGLAGKAVA